MSGTFAGINELDLFFSFAFFFVRHFKPSRRSHRVEQPSSRRRHFIKVAELTSSSAIPYFSRSFPTACHT
jgi:hypothetical protein